MTAITLAQVTAIADFQTAGKSPWITIKEDAVQGVYVNRDAARAAKTGKPVKHEEPSVGAYTLIDGPVDLPKGEDIADAMGHVIDDKLSPEAQADADVVNASEQDPDAAEFADAKDNLPADLTPSVQPIPPVASAPSLPADKPAKPDVRHASEVMRPTKLVWSIADRMCDEAKAAGRPVPTRKEVMAECERVGIAFYTARTQYQVWKSMQP